MLKIFENNAQSTAVWSGLDAWKAQSGAPALEQPVLPESLEPAHVRAAAPAPAPEPAQAPAPEQIHPIEPVGVPRASSLNTVAFCGASGGVGKTSLAINVAFELASASKRVALIDLDVSHPNLLTALNQESLTAGLAGAHRLISQGRFTSEDLDRLLMVLNFDGMRLWVLPGLAKPAEAQTRIELTKSLGELVDALSESFDWVVFDLSSSSESDELVQACLGLVDYAFAVCGGEPSAVQRYLWAKSGFKSGLANEPQVIVNGFRDSVVGADSKRQIADTLGRAAEAEVVAFVPHDQAAFDFALLEGLPLQLARKASPARHAISMFVRQGLLGQRANLDWRLLRG